MQSKSMQPTALKKLFATCLVCTFREYFSSTRTADWEESCLCFLIHQTKEKTSRTTYIESCSSSVDEDNVTCDLSCYFVLPFCNITLHRDYPLEL